MQGRINLFSEQFSEKEKVVFTKGEFSVSTFVYSTGVKAVRLSNGKGYIVLLPFMGQMIWDAEFMGRSLVMKSIYDEPEICYDTYGESYGCFLMHCGLTAMGNPTPEDTHLPHGELPVAHYDVAYLVSGNDEKGAYIGIGGTYSHKRCFELYYEFSPLVKLYAGKTEIEAEVRFTNLKDLPMEYFYLCHINHLPVDGAKLQYTADRKKIITHHEVPENYPKQYADATNAYLKALDKDITLMDDIGGKGQSYHPEIVFTCFYSADENGDAYTMQVNPDGTATYVCHRPSELPYGVRWISRTREEDALGMVLPATAQHMGYLYCKANGQEKCLQTDESVVYHIRTGLLDKPSADAMQDKIKKLGF